MKRRQYRRKKWKSGLSPRDIGAKGSWAKQIALLKQYRDMYNRQLPAAEYTTNPYEVDHCIPRSLGGLDIFTNMWIVRRSMNWRGPQRRTVEQMEYALTQANLDRFKPHETWPNS